MSGPGVPFKATTVIDSDSDDEPIMAKPASKPQPAVAGLPSAPSAQNGANKPAKVVEDSDSDDDLPLASRVPVAKAASAPKPAPVHKRPSLLDDAEELPPAPKPKPKPAPVPVKKDVKSDSDDDIPLAQRRKSLTTSEKEKKVVAKKPQPKKEPSESKPKRKRESEDRPPKRSKSENSNGNAEVRWKTLVHHGVLFPPEYSPHGVKMLYDGAPITLTPEQEEVATFFAVMKETDYMNKPIFLRNFWEGFQEVLGPNHIIKSLDKCDFTPIYEYHMAEREKQRNMSKEEKAAVKRERDDREAKYKIAVVDGKEEQVGNFRVEPPGLFRGRGEHPKMGKIKKRIYPRDITINIGEGVPVPEHPFPGQRWKEVRHDQTVTWLAFWKDPINSKEYKYVFLAATSSWKSESDLQKYEKARKLKDSIEDIRSTYTKNWDSKERRERQMATALYFIDKLALRAGHEKDDDEADTVGCCTLKCENVECVPPNIIRFDFLGKDSIRYENEVEVEDKVYANVAAFKRENAAGRRKADGEQLFDEFDAQDLNTRLKDLMEGLSVKVFRTYNASITLDTLLSAPSHEDTVEGKKAVYDRANKEVAILCNHQRSVPKGHTGQMEKLQEKLAHMQHELQDLYADLKAAQKGKANKDGKVLSEDTVRKRIEKKRQAIVKLEINAKNKEDLKTVALGTSKLNYLDPRITVAWCKRNEVPIEKIFNKSLLSKFLWAMDVEGEFKF